MLNNYSNKGINIAALVFATIIMNVSKAVTVFTSNVSTGNWGTASTWVRTGSGTPVKYRIMAGHSITVDANVSNVDTVWISGTLNMGNNKTLSVNTNGTVILDWGGTIQGGSNNTGFIMIGATYTVWGPFTSANMITNGPRWMTATSVNNANGDPQGSFSQLSTLLPVELASIAVENNSGNFELNWTALGESNQNTFVVEVSSNGSDFAVAGTVAGTNELDKGDYSFQLGSKNANFYVRLSEINANGNKIVLALKYVNADKNTDVEFGIFPNLISNIANLNVVIPTAGEYSLKVYNMNMQTVGAININTASENETTQINGNDLNLQSGNYVVVVSGTQGEVYKTRIVVR